MSSPTLDRICLRIAEPGDVDALTRVINAAFAVERFFIEGDRIQADAVRKLLGTGQFLIAQDNDGLAACVYVESRGEHAYLGLLSVDPSRQRSGLGSRLIAAAEEHARGRGIRHMDLRIINLRTELPEYYARRGYVATGTSPLAPDVLTKLSCHFINMTKPLT